MYELGVVVRRPNMPGLEDAPGIPAGPRGTEIHIKVEIEVDGYRICQETEKEIVAFFGSLFEGDARMKGSAKSPEPTKW